jgi:Scavenger receptor cysteine-rich domain
MTANMQICQVAGSEIVTSASQVHRHLDSSINGLMPIMRCRWGTICKAQNFGQKNAQVACRSVGLPAAGALSNGPRFMAFLGRRPPGPVGPDTLPVLTPPSIFTCTGTEADLSGCTLTEQPQEDYLPNDDYHRPSYAYYDVYDHNGDCDHNDDMVAICSDGKLAPRAHHRCYSGTVHLPAFSLLPPNCQRCGYSSGHVPQLRVTSTLRRCSTVRLAADAAGSMHKAQRVENPIHQSEARVAVCKLLQLACCHPLTAELHQTYQPPWPLVTPHVVYTAALRPQLV